MLQSPTWLNHHFHGETTILPQVFMVKFPPFFNVYIQQRCRGRQLRLLRLSQRGAQRHFGGALCGAGAPGRLPRGAGEHETRLGRMDGFPWENHGTSSS